MSNRNCCRHIPYMLFTGSPHLLFTDRSTCHVRTTQEVWWKASVTYIGKPWRWLWNILWMTFTISCQQFVEVWCGLPVMFLGDIFIHCLATYRTPMEDPPSISEGCGGRVTDYRINVSLICSFKVFVVCVLSGCSVCIQANWSISWSLSQFLYHRATRNISTSPGWVASQLQGYLPHKICSFAFVHLDVERHCENKVSCPITQHYVTGRGLNLDHSILSQAH